MSNISEKVEMPYFKLFIKDEIANLSLLGMDATDYGAFCIFRNLIWARGFLSSEKKNLAKILRISAKKFEEIWENISPLFSEMDGKLIIAELEIQRAKYSEFIEKSREGGRNSREKQGNVGSTSLEGGLNEPSSNYSLKENHTSKSKGSNTQNSELNEKIGKVEVDDMKKKANRHTNGNEDEKENRVRDVGTSRFPENVRNEFFNFFIKENSHLETSELMNDIRLGKYDHIIESAESNLLNF